MQEQKMLNDKIKDLYDRAGFSCDVEGKWPNIFSVGTPLEKLIAIVVDDCAKAAEEHARSYSDGDAGKGAHGAANAVRHYGNTLFKQ
jgi:hypothetical protein